MPWNEHTALAPSRPDRLTRDNALQRTPHRATVSVPAPVALAQRLAASSMVRVSKGGAAIALEVWQLTATGFVAILNREAVGLSVGKVELASGERVLGVIGEPVLCEEHKEITEFGGWRSYRESIDHE